MLIAILAGILFSILLLFIGKWVKTKLQLLPALLPLGLFIYFVQFFPAIAAGEVVEQHYNWVSSFGVDLSFRLDGLAFLFTLLITGIGFLVFLYTSAYLKNNDYLDRFYGYLSIFMAAMLGLVLSDNIMSLFLFWELTSISSFFLIGFNNKSEASRKSALWALGVTGIGGLLLLAGAVVLGIVADTYTISEMVNQKALIASSPLYILIAIFIFGAAFTKSAQFPFHFWLPGAMKAPTPVSTYLHSATMVKAGVYLLFRLTPVLGDNTFWNTTLMLFGGVTMLYAAIHTIFRKDLKGILAYSTISALGILVFLIGLGTKEALLAAAVFILVHALYKATLFLVTGTIDLSTGTRDVSVLAGLKKIMLPVAIAGFLAALSNAGIPSSIGFIGKDLIYEGTLHVPNSVVLLTSLAVITNIFISYAGYLVGVKPFLGKLPARFEMTKTPEIRLWLPPVILASLGIVLGLMPSLIQDSLIKPILSSVAIDASDIHLKLWHGFTPVLALSVTTIVGGLLLYFLLKPTDKLVNFSNKLEVISPKSIIEKLTSLFETFSGWWTRVFQNGYLRNYVSVIIFVAVVLMAYRLLQDTSYVIDYNSFSKLTVYEVVVLVIMVGAIFFTIFAKSRLAAVAASGVIGYAICLLFVFYSAPDLAMTQFAIDTLTVILFVLVLYRLPKYLVLSDYKQRIRDGILACSFGGLISVLALEVLAQPVNEEISKFYAENAYILAHGKNVVNVILVDFRGTDTMVEISVLAIAAIGVFALLKLRLRGHEREQK
ncbi:MAG: putative monovalent cation/H+ antiporter subunit A [Mesonia hippocampi]|uniref:putative monovalent cation/H+ antiporter subunit A n=1 Tax=Mesonia hippocampi TaxID=1628250 RepID=UPI003F970A61